MALEVLIAKLRAYPDVPGLRKRPGRGRPKEELLTSVWQTLRAGGLTFREIADLVPPSDAGDNVEDVIERIEKRVKDEMLWVTDNQPDERFVLKVAQDEPTRPDAGLAADVTAAHAGPAPVSVGQDGGAVNAAPESEPAGNTADSAPAGAAPLPAPPENIQEVFSPADLVDDVRHVELADHDAEDTKDGKRKP